MNTIIFSASIISCYLSLFCITKKDRSKADFLLFIYFLIHSIIFFISYLSYEFKGLEDLQFFLINIELLTTPILYFYVHFLISGKAIIKKKTYKYFIPYFVSFTYLAIKAIELSKSEFDMFINKPFLDQPLFFGAISIMEFLAVPFYSVLIFKLLLKHKVKIKELYSYKKGIDLNWLNLIVVFFVMGWLFIYIPYFFKWSEDLRLGLTLNAVLIFYIGFFGIRQTQIFIKENDENHKSNGDKYKKSGINNSSIEGLKAKLVNYMEKEKPYLDNELSIYKIAKDLDVSSHILSQVFTIGLNKSFYSVINEYRVQEFKRKIEAGEHKTYTLLSIAMDSGFNSKSSFNRIFKNVTGTTPSSYIKMGKIPTQNE